MLHRAAEASRHEAENAINSGASQRPKPYKGRQPAPRSEMLGVGQERYCSFSLPDRTSK